MGEVSQIEQSFLSFFSLLSLEAPIFFFFILLSRLIFFSGAFSSPSPAVVQWGLNGGPQGALWRLAKRTRHVEMRMIPDATEKTGAELVSPDLPRTEGTAKMVVETHIIIQALISVGNPLQGEREDLDDPNITSLTYIL